MTITFPKRRRTAVYGIHVLIDDGWWLVDDMSGQRQSIDHDPTPADVATFLNHVTKQ